MAEVRIGELLGNGKVGRPAKIGTRAGFPVAERDRVRFRLLAECRELVLRLITMARLPVACRMVLRYPSIIERPAFWRADARGEENLQKLARTCECPTTCE